jgi:hypothetical protein
MMIFHSYVSLPEGIYQHLNHGIPTFSIDIVGWIVSVENPRYEKSIHDFDTFWLMDMGYVAYEMNIFFGDQRLRLVSNGMARRDVSCSLSK